MSTFHIEYKGKNAKVDLRALAKKEAAPKGERFTTTGPVQRHKVLSGLKDLPVSKETEEALKTGNPELNLEEVGRILDGENLTGVYLDGGDRPVSDFEIVEVVTDTAGEVKETRKQPNRNTNLDTAMPIKVLKFFPAEQVLTRFIFKASYQMVHSDGLTKSFLHELAKDLAAKNEVAAIGSGAKGNGPIVLKNGSLPVRGFLLGQVNGEEYKLILMVTDTEMKRPAAVEKPAEKPVPASAPVAQSA